MKKSQNPSSIRSKKEITDALIKQMQDNPFSEITVKQIVLETGLERKTTVIFDFCDKNRELLQLLHKNNMSYLLLLKLNVVIPELNKSLDMSNNPFRALIGSLEPDYLIAFNIGAIWNVIFKWVDRGMTDSPDYIKETLEDYLKRL